MPRLFVELFTMVLVVCGFSIVVCAVFPKSRRVFRRLIYAAARAAESVFGATCRAAKRILLFLWRGFTNALELSGWVLERLCTLVTAWITSLHNALVSRWPRATRVGYGVFLAVAITLLITSFT